jgi:hypothetical protein
MRACSSVEANGTTWVDVAQVVAAGAGIVVVLLGAIMPFVRRPRLSLTEDELCVHSRVEDTNVGRIPHARLLVGNAKWRRAAQGHALSSSGTNLETVIAYR